MGKSLIASIIAAPLHSFLRYADRYEQRVARRRSTRQQLITVLAIHEDLLARVAKEPELDQEIIAAELLIDQLRKDERSRS